MKIRMLGIFALVVGLFVVFTQNVSAHTPHVVATPVCGPTYGYTVTYSSDADYPTFVVTPELKGIQPWNGKTSASGTAHFVYPDGFVADETWSVIRPTNCYPPTPTPTKTTVPPTKTVVPPTVVMSTPTPVQPTATLIKPTPTTASTPIPPTATTVPNTPQPPSNDNPPQPTATAVPPTATSIPPTATVIPRPTLTAVPTVTYTATIEPAVPLVPYPVPKGLPNTGDGGTANRSILITVIVVLFAACVAYILHRRSPR